MEILKLRVNSIIAEGDSNHVAKLGHLSDILSLSLSLSQRMQT